MEHTDCIMDFIRCPLDSADEIFRRFATLPGAVCAQGEQPLQRYLYVPGTRKDRVVLVAHADTVWDRAYDKADVAPNELLLTEKFIYRKQAECGIGADDRAGCAMLWALRCSGHSLLLTDGEEHGKHGARFLRQSNPALYRELNSHRFFIQLDWIGTGTCLFTQVYNTKRFEAYIQNTLGFTKDTASAGCDLQILCGRVCGVNVGIGYHNYHTHKEFLNLEEWEYTYTALQAFLQKPQPEFRLLPFTPLRRFYAKCKGMSRRLYKGAMRRLSRKKPS